MSRPGRAALLGLALAWTARAYAPVAAQEAPRTEAELVAHLDSLIPSLRLARKRALEARERRERERLAAEQPSTDTVAVGPMRIIAREHRADQAREMFEKAWETYAPFVDASPTLATRYFTFEWPSDGEPIVTRSPPLRVELSDWFSTLSVERAIRLSIGNALKEDLRGSPLRAWFNTAVAPHDDPSRLYYEFATLPISSARACVTGSALGCWSTMGLVDPANHSWRDWYAPEDLPLVVRSHRTHFRGPGESEKYERCSRQESLQDCIELFDFADELGVVRPPVVYSPDTQMALLWVVLQRGGEGAWSRLLAAGDDVWSDGTAPDLLKLAPRVRTALTAAAGIPEAELAELWRDYLLEHAPRPQARLAGSGLLASLWILFFAALAMRSTRWRLG